MVEHTAFSRRFRIGGTLVALLVTAALVLLGAPSASATTATTATTATMQGQVLGQMDPLGGARVAAVDAASGVVVKAVTADGSGNWRISGLAPGSYKVRATKAGWITSWADGARSAGTARVFTLQAGQTLTQSWGPVALYLDLVPEAAFEGQVLGWFDPLTGARVTVFDADTGAAVRSAVTDGGGNYRIGGLVAGRYVVRATKAGWLTGWANGAASRATATVFTLREGQTITQTWDPMNLYIDLVPESVVQGSVLGISDDPSHPWDDPLPGVTVTVFNASTGAAVRSATTDGLGHYRIGGLVEGDYKVRAAKGGWITTWANGRATKATADPVHTSPSGPATVDMTIDAEAAMQGQVLGEMDPLGGATVTVFSAGTGNAVRSVVADGSGNWRIGGLAAGSYKVRATRSGWTTSWANGRATKATADVVTLVSGQTLSQSWDPNVLYLDLTRSTPTS